MAYRKVWKDEILIVESVSSNVAGVQEQNSANVIVPST